VSSGRSPREHLSEEKLARAALTYLAEPGDPALGALLAICSPAEVLAAIKADMLPGTGPGCGDTPASRAALERALGRWRARLPMLPHEERLADTSRDGIRLSCPGDTDWPGALDQLGQDRPYALWLRGHTDLRFACSRSVSMVGSRAATSYGGHVAGEIAADLGERGWAVISGGAYGIDAAAHRGALAAEAVTIAVLACGVDYPYPAGHADLFAAIAGQGLVVSEWPPGCRPARTRFLVRNRVIAALRLRHRDRGGRRAQRRAEHRTARRHPGQAADGRARAGDVGAIRRMPPDHQGLGRQLRDPCRGHHRTAIAAQRPGRAGARRRPGRAGAPAAVPAVRHGRIRTPTALASRDDLDPDSARVLDALPTRGGAGTSTIAVEAGVDLDTVLRCLGRLAGYGFIERCDRGWRLRRS
jgi:DNA processing protein